MAQKTVAQLKAIFVTGAKPTQQNFADLLESYWNFLDNGTPVQTVTATDASIAIGGTATNPTVRATGTLPQKTITNANSPYTVLPTDYTLFCDAIAGDINITMPLATSFPGRILIVKKIDNSGNVVNSNGSGGEKIDNFNPLILSNQFDSFQAQSDGTIQWWLIAHNP